MVNEPYQPISCVFHEALQYAVIKRSLLDICWRGGDGGEQRVRALPVDVLTQAKEEFLELDLGGGVRQRIRLDQLLKVIAVQQGERLLG